MAEATDRRSQIRELAFTAHYAAQIGGLMPESALKAAAEIGETEKSLIPAAFPYLQAWKYRSLLDARIEANLSANWPLTRVGWPERIVLRQAAAERLVFPSIPMKVTVAESLKLTERFGGEGSVRFVHGVLSNLVKNLEDLPLAPLREEDVPPELLKTEDEVEEKDAETVVAELLEAPEETIRWQIRSGPLL